LISRLLALAVSVWQVLQQKGPVRGKFQAKDASGVSRNKVKQLSGARNLILNTLEGCSVLTDNCHVALDSNNHRLSQASSLT